MNKYFNGTECKCKSNWIALLELQLGELVHHQKLFGLFEAMSAIEMMDPKMDAGMRCNKNPSGPLTFEVAVSVSYIKK